MAEHPRLPRMTLAGDGAPPLLFCDNDTNTRRLWGLEGAAFPKDGINDHVVSGLPTVNPERTGTKAALRYRLTVAAGESTELRLRLAAHGAGDLGASWEATMGRREEEADGFYRSLVPGGLPEEGMVARQAFAGMVWGKQYYGFDVGRWLDGDPRRPAPPSARRHARNAGWRHLDTHDVISKPDPWEYPWFAAWDLAFHTVALAHLDPEFAQLQLVGQPQGHQRRLRFRGRLPGLGQHRADRPVLDAAGRHPPRAVHGTAWMAAYSLNPLEMALLLADHDPTYEDLAVKFNEHFAYIATATHEQGLWIGHVHRLGEHEGRLVSVVSPERLWRILQTMLDEAEFLSSSSRCGASTGSSATRSPSNCRPARPPRAPR